MAMTLLNTPKIGSVPAMVMPKKPMSKQQKQKMMTKDQMVSSMSKYHGK